MNTYQKYKALLIAFVLISSPAFAQVGEDNNTGTSGFFQGEVTTGCSYNAYTGNAIRSVTDITVAGAVGTYPLQFTRTSTSRYTKSLIYDMGTAGSWRHSYEWSIDTFNSPTSLGVDTPPSQFFVNYPDGKRVTFIAYSQFYILPAPGVRGVMDFIFDNSDPSHKATADISLPDGGHVRFAVAITNNRQTFTYTLQSVTDPYGQITTIVTTGSGNSKVTTVTENAKRMLKMFYGTGPAGDSVITRVEEWLTTGQKGRTVLYSYSLFSAGNSQLGGVSYLNADGTTYAAAAYTYQNDNVSTANHPLLSSCNDPMYLRPMRKISYSYAAAGRNQDGTNVVSGQILSEKSGTTGQAVSTLTIGESGRGETTGDGRSRSFTFQAGGLVSTSTDFLAKSMSLKYEDANGVFPISGFPTSAIDRKGNKTTRTYGQYTHLPFSTTFPATPEDVPAGTPQGTVSTTYGNSTCADPNNHDPYHGFFPCTQTDEAGHVTQFYLTLAGYKAIREIDYPDGGVETFTYNNFGQVLTHRLRTGGLETFEYDGRGLLTAYRDAYHLATVDPQNPNVKPSATPSVQYAYDSLDRVTAVSDALASGTTDPNHTTNYVNNWRGQVTTTTLPIDPIDNQRHTIVKVYNDGDGTLKSVTDQLLHVTSYIYDDYRRVRSVTTPGHNTSLPTQFFYDATGTGDDYTHTDANVTYTISPSGKKLISQYNANKQKRSTTTVAADGATDSATTSFGYDDNGNLTSVASPNEQPAQQFAGKSTNTAYDERNRPMSITDSLTNPTTLMYDAGGRKASMTRANTQLTTFDSYDSMNRLLQQTVQQGPNPNAVTKYSYYPSGLLHTMQDPRLVATSSNYAYTYAYDLMGRKTGLNYPPDSGSVQQNELWHFDTNGRIDTFTNRNSKTQTTSYDNLNRPTNVSWNDSSLTPVVTYGYDVASRPTNINNGNATIARVLFNDGLLNTETTTYADHVPRTVTYTYDLDSNRATIQWPNNAYSFTYKYTGRNQLQDLVNNATNADLAHYVYDPDGNLTTRNVVENSTSSTFVPDALDRVFHIAHTLTGTTRTLDYAYDSVGNRKWAKRDNSNGDVFSYDLNDQSIAAQLNIPNPDTVTNVPQTIYYDANGNRTTFSTDTYVIDNNSLNQYHTRDGIAASYDPKGNMTAGFDGSTYTYDAKNRLLSATKPPAVTPVTISYDGLNRAVKRIGNRTVQVVSVVSRITHGSAGTFDVALPLTGSPGIECRSQSGNFKIVVTFSTGVSYAGATVSSGTGSISGTSLSSDHTQITVNLTGVANAQTIVVTLSGVTDGVVINDVPVAMGVLSGDTNGNGVVSNADVAQTQSQSGQSVSAANFREDVNANGLISSGDVSLVQAQVGSSLGSFTENPPVPGPTYYVYDGWNLIGEYAPGATSPSSAYLAGSGRLVKNLVSGVYYYQDASGSTSHLADSGGNLLEWYRYDLQGTPVFYNASNSQVSGTAYGIRRLFTGQQWYSDIALYDLRNRFYSPDIGRFLQSDPSSFAGDPTHLYRYCANNALKYADPSGENLYQVITQYWAHAVWGVTDPLADGGITWFEFGPTRGASLDWVPGRYDIGVAQPYGILNGNGGLVQYLSPEQDLVVLSAVADAADAGDQIYRYNWTENNCYQEPSQLIQASLYSNGNLINPVDPYTGNIYDAQGTWVGWEDPNTGNIYDADGQWFSWNPNWNSGSNTGSNVGYGAGSPFGAGMAGPSGAGFNGFGGLGGFAGPDFGNWDSGSGGGGGSSDDGCNGDPTCKHEK